MGTLTFPSQVPHICLAGRRLRVYGVHMSAAARTTWIFAITGVGLFMAVLDNLVVTNALPSIRESLGSSIENLEWAVNAYTLAFAVLLLTAAALGDRFGRRRVYAIGVAVFTVASAAAALSPNIETLIASRALQGAGAAAIMPLSLTILSEAVPPARRGAAIGVWSAIAGVGVAFGPLVGGAVVSGISWHWIFWLNVPIGIVLVPLALVRLPESVRPGARLDLVGVALASVGLLGLVWGLVRGNPDGWTSPSVLVPIVAGALVTAAFVAWEARARNPMLPMAFFRNRSFAATNGTTLLMYFGMFGSIFLIAQFLQTVQGYSAFGAGVRTLPWTLPILIVAPVAGLLSDRIGGRPLLVGGMLLQTVAMAWMAMIYAPTMAYSELVVPFLLAGIGMGLVFPPAASVVLGAVRPEQAGQASGANNMIRELGGVFGIAVMTSVFTHAGGFASPQAFTDGLVAAVWVGAAVLAVGTVVALAVPGRPRPAPAPEPAGAVAEPG